MPGNGGNDYDSHWLRADVIVESHATSRIPVKITSCIRKDNNSRSGLTSVKNYYHRVTSNLEREKEGENGRGGRGGGEEKR